MKQPIKTALLGNAIFSTTSGLLLLFFSKPINTWMGISLSWILPLIGLGLLGFAASLFLLSKKQMITRNAVIGVIIQDALWVLGSILIVALGAFNLSEIGYEMIIILFKEISDISKQLQAQFRKKGDSGVFRVGYNDEKHCDGNVFEHRFRL